MATLAKHVYHSRITGACACGYPDYVDTFLTTFGAEIRRLRLARRLTQDALAERCHLTPKYLSEVENGHVNPSLRVLDALARQGFGITLAELFSGPAAWSTARPQIARIVSMLDDESEEVCAVVARVVESVLAPIGDLHAPTRKRAPRRRKPTGSPTETP